MSSADGEPFLTEDEVVARYRNALTAGTLRNWRSQGQGPAFTRIGKAVLYARTDLEAWEASQRVAPSEPRGPSGPDPTANALPPIDGDGAST